MMHRLSNNTKDGAKLQKNPDLSDANFGALS